MNGEIDVGFVDRRQHPLLYVKEEEVIFRVIQYPITRVDRMQLRKLKYRLLVKKFLTVQTMAQSPTGCGGSTTLPEPFKTRLDKALHNLL